MNAQSLIVKFDDNSAVLLLYVENTGLTAQRGHSVDEVFEPTHEPDDFLFADNPHLISMWTPADGWNRDEIAAFLFDTMPIADDNGAKEK